MSDIHVSHVKFIYHNIYILRINQNGWFLFEKHEK